MKLAVLAVALLLPLATALASVSVVQFDFFYLVQQWPGSLCDTQSGCCFPADTGKPVSEFGIHGLWPNYMCPCRSGSGDGGASVDAMADVVLRLNKCYPEFCNNSDPLSLLEIKDLVKQLDRDWPTLSCKNAKSMEFWSYEWLKHGTCSNLGQHGYFNATLVLKAGHNLIAILADAGIVPSDDETYLLSSIGNAIQNGIGFRANLECNLDASGEAQLFQVYQCVDRSGKRVIDCDCPLQMKSKCLDRVKLPTF